MQENKKIANPKADISQSLAAKLLCYANLRTEPTHCSLRKTKSKEYINIYTNEVRISKYKYSIHILQFQHMDILMQFH